MSQPAFFFDRDGVVNRDPHPEPYVLSWRQWQWMPGIVEMLQFAKKSGFELVLVTSQKGVGKGLMCEADLAEIHACMQEHLDQHGVSFAAIYAFTELPKSVNQPKPDPQMLQRAADELNLDLARSWLIGDADRDIEMARKAGVGRVIRLRGLKPIGIAADFEVDSLEAALADFRREVKGE